MFFYNYEGPIEFFGELYQASMLIKPDVVPGRNSEESRLAKLGHGGVIEPSSFAPVPLTFNDDGSVV